MSMLNRYSYTNREVVKKMRIWQTQGLSELMDHIYIDLEKSTNKEKRVVLIRLNQLCKQRL
jgi:hypothetical protein